MKKVFDWDKFITEKITVHCKTEEEAYAFHRMFFDKRIRRNNIESTYWNNYKESTCYDIKDDVFWNYGSKKWYENNGYTVLEFSDYFDIDESNAHYGEINFNGDCFIVKEKDECDYAEWKYLCDLFGLDHEYTERIVIDGVVKYFGLRK